MKIFKKSLEDDKLVFLAVIWHVIVNIYKFLEKKIFVQKKIFFGRFFEKNQIFRIF